MLGTRSRSVLVFGREQMGDSVNNQDLLLYEACSSKPPTIERPETECLVGPIGPEDGVSPLCWFQIFAGGC